LDAERGAHDRMGAALFGGGRPVEKGDVGTRRGFAVAIKEVIGGGIVLVDGALDQPQAEDFGIKTQVFTRIGGDGGEVMQSGKIERHFGLPSLVDVSARPGKSPVLSP